MNVRSASRHRLAAAALAALALVSACGDSEGENGSSAGDKPPLRVLFVGGLTGPLSTTAVAVERGVKANVEYINSKGGIKGRKIELTSKDDGSDPTRAVSVLQAELTGDAKPDLVIAGVGSNEALAMAPLLARNKVVGIASAVSPKLNDPKQYPYFFSQAFPASDQVKAAAVYLEGLGNVKKVALVAPSDALGDGTAANFAAAFTGGTIKTEVFRFPTDAVDFTPILQKTVASKPDWIYMEGSGAQAPILLASREKAGATSIKTIAGATASSQPLLELGKGEQLTNLYATLTPNAAYIEPSKRTEEFNEFFSRVREQGPLATTPYVYSVGWDNISIWAKALERIDGDITGEKVKAAFESEPAKEPGAQFPVFSGQYTPDNHMHGGHPEDFTFAQLQEKKDDMLVIKPE
jgi:ABC-type branched-subunit amino acid transport system substrate-binding protein